ncbi:MAG: hypothetical protein HY775_13205, partial [Acidobacteria bacterium]|nr:hypothetical protein [Acidobacteriota bacterium]
LITGIVLIVQVLLFPGGTAGAFARLEGGIWGLWPRGRTAAPAPEALDGAA